MRTTFRSKLFAIVGSAALGFLVLAISSSVLADRVADRLASIREHYVPRVGLQPKLEADFDRLKRAFQDAVAAHDTEALEHTKVLRDDLYKDLQSGGRAIDPVAAARVHVTLDAYFTAAYDVARRMMAGEGGEGLVTEIERMQARQAEATTALHAASAVDAAALAEAFDDVERAQQANARIRLGTSIAFIAAVVLLSLYLSRGSVRAIDALAAGLERLGRGKFDEPIEVTSHDELGDIAERANRTAEDLARFVAERDAADRVKAVHAGLALELRGELEPREVARRALIYVSDGLEAVGGALYWLDDDKTLRLAAHCGAGDGAAPAFAMGSGLVGEAAQKSALTIVKSPPADYLRVKSGLGEGAVATILIAPLRRGDRALGVIELAFLTPWRSADDELVEGLAEAIAIAMEIARGAAATAQLLAQTQALAKRLSLQEEELRTANEELEAQQTELRSSNAHLERHTDELEQQRVVLEERNVELGEARRRFEQKAAELGRVSAYKSQFLANMSHELRTPLNSMLLLSKLLADNDGGNLTEKQVEFSKTIHAAGSDLLALINQILDLAKVESGKQEVRIAETLVRDVSAHAARVFGPLAKRKGLELEVEVAEDVPEKMTTDGQRLTQILTNLIGNAIKFTEKGKVSLRICRPPAVTRFRVSGLDAGRALAFTVADTGIGIAPEHQQRIFAPFEQVHGSADRSHGGTGLGLAIARELAVLLGGDLVLESVPSKGSTFTCYLPIVAKEPKDRAPSSLVEDDRDRLRPEDAYLLVIEDDPIFAQRVGEAVRGQGLKYVVSADGVSALSTARARPPAGIVLDVKLPDIDGWAVMEELRRDPMLRGIAVHFVSAVDDAEKGLAMGAIGYLTKPATSAELSAMVGSLAPREKSLEEIRIFASHLRDGIGAHAPAPLSLPSNVRFDGRVVLLVDDDMRTVYALSAALRAKGVDVVVADTGVSALQALDERPDVDAVLMDIMMPEMDGYEAMRRIRAQGRFRALPIIALTAKAMKDDRAKCIEAGANDYLPKPVDAARLLALLQHALTEEVAT